MSSPLISVEALQKVLDTRPLIIDCRFNLLDKKLGFEQYAEGHIPGAFYLDLEKDLSGPVSLHGGRHPLPSTEQFAHTLRLMGLSSERQVVVYDNSQMAYAARCWWLLKYFGHDNVSLLDGGYSAWVEGGGLVDRRQPKMPLYGHFIAQPGQRPVRHIEEIKSLQGQLTLIDSREPVRYAGIEEPIDPVAGHIPGALNVHWQLNLDENGKFHKPEFHKSQWQHLDPAREIVVYCGSGVTACVNLLSLELAGIPASLYPGSWSDWSSYLVDGE